MPKIHMSLVCEEIVANNYIVLKCSVTLTPAKRYYKEGAFSIVVDPFSNNVVDPFSKYLCIESFWQKPKQIENFQPVLC